MEKTVALQIITSAQELLTSREETRAGFIAMVLEKNLLAEPMVLEARALKAMAMRVSKPEELLGVKELRIGLLTASGISEKALGHLGHEDQNVIIQTLIDKVLAPSGELFRDELIYRYLLIKGDSLGGKIRNLAGALGERKLISFILTVLKLSGNDFSWFDDETKKWYVHSNLEVDVKRVNGLSWTSKGEPRVLLFNIKVPVVGKNVDLALFKVSLVELNQDRSALIRSEEKYLALGELKGGIDPAGADEHWKTARSALGDIREKFEKKNHKPSIFFIGAAIGQIMAREIFEGLQNGSLANAANLTKDNQLTISCQWLINL